MEAAEETTQKKLPKAITAPFRNKIYHTIYMITECMSAECAWLKETAYNISLSEDNVYVL